MLSVFASLDQFEREILARRAEVIAIAKCEGHMGGPEIQPCDNNFTSIVTEWQYSKILL